MKVPFVDLTTQFQAMRDEVVPAMTKIMQGAHFILGEEVALFEKEFAAFCEAGYAVGVDSGTSALELALRAYHIGPGDEVITVTNSFIATALAISRTGATPVFVDVAPPTYTLDVSQLPRALTSHTKAIIPVHLYGHPADMDTIMEIAQAHNLVVIEDACQAHGARYKGRRAGSLGHAAAFSFYPAKNLGAYGDGGMVVTSDEQVTAKIRMLRDYGQREKYHHLMQGFNHRLDTLQAAVLRAKLKHLDAWNQARRRHARQYAELLAQSPAVLPAEADYAEAVYHLYVIRVDDRNELKAYLQSQGIATGIHYPIPIHLQPAYRDLGYHRGDFPVAERDAKQMLSLPMYPELDANAIEFVAETINAFIIRDGMERLAS